MKKTVLLCALALVLAGCAPQEEAQPDDFPCQVVLEDGEGFRTAQPVRTVERGGDAVFSLQVLDGWALTGADYPGARLERDGQGGMTLILPQVRYSTVVTLSVEQDGLPIRYHANGGTLLDGGGEEAELTATPSHLRLNTSIGTDLFSRAGYTLTGWNTRPDGSGTAVGLGGRILWQEGLTLYAQWVRWTDEACFGYELEGGFAVITSYDGQEAVLAVPARLGGCPVGRIAADAFAGANCRTVVLPETLRVLEDGAFRGASVETLYLFDSVTAVSDYVFEGCEGLRTLHLNAALPPVYSGSYYASFADKYDCLLSLQNERKLVLFSGSSTRFGYDSAMLDAALPGYEVVNMGVFAYTNAAPQLMLILDCMGEGDILLHAPEFDASQRQFCTSSRLDAPFFALMEANYDMLAGLDLRQFDQVFTALSAYLSGRSGMAPRSYALSPAQFDEDGAPVDQPSYNEYGDYVLYRPNAASDEPVYGLAVPYTVGAFPRAGYLDPLNAMYRRFLDRGVDVYFTYAPRNQYALSPESTPQARAELDRYFRENLIVPVLLSVEDSLYPGTYLSGTDNHLSTEGVRLRTEQIAAALQAQLDLEKEEGGA